MNWKNIFWGRTVVGSIYPKNTTGAGSNIYM
jgi:hypothetical protein